ncbi:enoyl-CoA hydratase-related protein [Desmospora profundinema]|uniref:Enoyl-CoA hydratase n=1 Tax=Desmospora profundinema TaxID=1571184 RepID=A0ABU1IMM6_9BACL|nr:enoyl-CoA hydratase-related protein [Desmospora profundinema]MDR6226036.1 enoyl-CoA hydratase [Desmospora profundinema]
MERAYLKVTRRGPVGWIQLDRPRVLNALNRSLIRELVQTLEEMGQDDDVRVAVITGGERVFAAGADIGEMAASTSVDMLIADPFDDWNRIRRFPKPLIASVSGFALGGGCELALACDLIVASETARLGQPEIQLGVIPGAGGTQRLTRALGKVRAMEMVLTGEPITAQEAHAAGLVNRVVPVENLEAETMKLAESLADKAPIALRLGKEAVRRAAEHGLDEALDYEQKLFFFLFGTEDQKEGMRAFGEKRKPRFQGK